MKKKIFILIGSIVLCGLTIVGCKVDPLFFPEQVPPQSGEEINVYLSPKEVKIEGFVDQKYVINSPKFQDNLVKVLVKYTDQDSERTVEITEFEKDYEIATAAHGKHVFTLQGQYEDGTLSKIETRSIENKGFYVDEVLKSFKIVQQGTFVRVSWRNEIERQLLFQVHLSGTENQIQSNKISDLKHYRVSSGNQGRFIVNDPMTGQTNEIPFTYNSVLTEGIDLGEQDKKDWTIFYDSPYNNVGWWTIMEAFNGSYSADENLNSTAKLNAVTSSDADKRKRTLIVHFTQSRKNKSNLATDILDKSPIGEFNLISLRKISLLFKAPGGHAIFPDTVKVYGIRSDRTEQVVATIESVKNKLEAFKVTDPSFIRVLNIVPDQNFDSYGDFIGIRLEIKSKNLGEATNSDDANNIIGLGEVYIKGDKKGRISL